MISGKHSVLEISLNLNLLSATTNRQNSISNGKPKNTTNNDYHIRDLLDPENCTLMLIEFQPQTAFVVRYQSFRCLMFPQIRTVFPRHEIIDRELEVIFKELGVIG